jgi:glycosyltransferase involved in cell wall biosynthesis
MQMDIYYIKKITNMKISFITTVFNEEDSIQEFLQSLFNQTKIPDEIIIVDAKSTDETVKKIKNLRVRLKKYNGRFILLEKKGNRSIGRNEAIKQAKGNIIVCSDSGNILDKNWVNNITKTFRKKNVDVVAGFYKGVARNVFQKCVIPYALIMPDRVDRNNFLPATRSVAFTKEIWNKVGGFNEKLSHNEDYAFAKALKKKDAKIVFNKDAIVYWKPRNTFKDAFIMMYRFAYGDAQERIIRPKVVIVFLRYFIGIILVVIFFITKSYLLLTIILFLLILYSYWAVLKNFKYVNEWQAVFILPGLQFVADWAVLKGTTLGLLNREISYN